MADFRAFTIAASVTAIVLGAGIGAAVGAISGPQPPLITRQQGPASSTPARPTPRGGPAMGGATMDNTAAGTSGMRLQMHGRGALTGPAALRLQSMPTGTVRVWRDLQGMLQIQLDLYGLTPGSVHTVSIDGPRSTALEPEVRFPAFGADSSGRANAMLTALNRAGALQTGSRVSFRLGTYGGTAGLDLPAEELIAQSAVLPDHPDGRQSVVIPRSYGPAGSYQGRLHGWAKISYSAATRTLSVTVTAFGLPPGPHAAHLHLGSCQDQGGVKYMLADYVANASGDIADQTRTVTDVSAAPPSHGWYINLHLGDSKAILASGMPTLSFRPELCANITSVQMAGHR
jgi:CHRD domain